MSFLLWSQLPLTVGSRLQGATVAFLPRPAVSQVPSIGVDKYPEYVKKIVATVTDTTLSVEVAASVVRAMKQRTLNKAAALKAVRQAQPGWSDQKICSSLALTSSDVALYQHWSSIL